VPIAFSNGDGSFHVTNTAIAGFATWAAQGTKLVSADFDGDGKADLALVGGAGWGSIPVAFSNGDGSFRVTNIANSSGFPSWAQISNGAAAVAGDFDGDGKGDIALVGGAPGWGSIPIAYSNGDGSFRVTNSAVPSFPIWATQANQVVAGDFNGDHKYDLALVGAAGWGSIPVALSNGDGTFQVLNQANTLFAGWAEPWSSGVLYEPSALGASNGMTGRAPDTFECPAVTPTFSATYNSFAYFTFHIGNFANDAKVKVTMNGYTLGVFEPNLSINVSYVAVCTAGPNNPNPQALVATGETSGQSVTAKLVVDTFNPGDCTF
jgi:hypothetical protein